MSKIAAGFAALVLTVSGVALASGTTPIAPVAPVKPAVTAATPAAPVKAHVNKVQTPTHISGTADTKAAPIVKPEAGKADVKAETAPVKKVDDKAAQGAAATTVAPAAKTTTN